MSESSERKLTLKQQRFVNYYVGECAGNATQAAIKAGYSQDTAYSIAEENLRKPEISAAIAEREHNATVSAGIDAELIKRMLLDVAQQAAKVQIIVDKEGNVKEMQDAASAARCLELLGRALGVFEADNKQLRHKVSIRNFSGSKSAADSSDD